MKTSMRHARLHTPFDRRTEMAGKETERASKNFFFLWSTDAGAHRDLYQ